VAEGTEWRRTSSVEKFKQRAILWETLDNLVASAHSVNVIYLTNHLVLRHLPLGISRAKLASGLL
jgi:hypothetical protein